MNIDKTMTRAAEGGVLKLSVLKSSGDGRWRSVTTTLRMSQVPLRVEVKITKQLSNQRRPSSNEHGRLMTRVTVDEE